MVSLESLCMTNQEFCLGYDYKSCRPMWCFQLETPARFESSSLIFLRISLKMKDPYWIPMSSEWPEMETKLLLFFHQLVSPCGEECMGAETQE